VLELLLVAAFTAHLVAVNVAAAGPLYCVLIEWSGRRRGDAEMATLARRFSLRSLAGFAVGLAMGGVLLAILWHIEPSYGRALARVPMYRWMFFGGELFFYLVCMVAYAALWTHASQRAWWHRLLAILAATNLLYHFPPFFTMLSLMSARPHLADAVLDRSLYVELFTDAETLSRVAHHWLSSLATAGVVLMLVAARHVRQAVPSECPDAQSWVTTFAARTALVATVLQLPTGVWVLLALPASAQSQLLGGEMTSTVLLVAAILCTVLLLQQLAAAAFGDSSTATVRKTALLLFVVLLLMSAVLHRARAKALHAEADARSDFVRAARQTTSRDHSIKTAGPTSQSERQLDGFKWQRQRSTGSA
jgi:hypothetical protein